jgi:hypothetical protein
MCTPSRLDPANEDPDDEDDDTPGRNPPDDEGGDPDDEPDHDEDNGLNAQDRIFMRLSEAINNLVCNNRHTSSLDDSKVKVCELDTFDGSEPRKLRTFFVQCELHFQSKPKTFHLDWAKVNFTQSYLKSMALKWFETDLLSDELSSCLDWVDDYSKFMLELQTNFRPHDPSGDAKMQLEQLNMREGQRINKCVVEFQRLASQVHGWGDGALCHQFYNGLPARIKDEISHMGKPTTLSEFKTLAQTIDTHYWECKGEISRENKSSSSNPVKPSTSDRASSHLSRSGNHRSGQNKSAKPASMSTLSASKAPDLNTKLGKDGKLMAEEHQRHFNKKLCLFCGGPGHSAQDCTKLTSRAAKGRAATVTPETKQGASSEAKKIVRDPPDSTWDEGRIDLTCAKELRLNAVALLNPTLLCPYISLLDYPSISEFLALVDCGSSHCFIETSLIRKQKLHTYLIPPILLRLFDSTCNATISEAIDLSIRFSSGKVTSEMFYVTPLDSSCLIIL